MYAMLQGSCRHTRVVHLVHSPVRLRAIVVGAYASGLLLSNASCGPALFSIIKSSLRQNASDATTRKLTRSQNNKLLSKFVTIGHFKARINRQFPGVAKVYTMFEALPKNAPMSPSEETFVLKPMVLRSNNGTARQMLTQLGQTMCTSSQPQSRKNPSDPNYVHLLPAIYKMAWNGGKDGGDPKAALLLIKARDYQFDPPRYLISKTEALETVETFRVSNQSDVWLYKMEAQWAIRQYWESNEDERQPLRDRIIDYLEKAWECSKDPRQARIISGLYSTGLVLPRDPAKGEMWLTRAAEAGHVRSGIQLAVSLGQDPSKSDNPRSFPANLSKARKWLEVTAEHASYAMYRLGLYYYLDPRSSWPTIEEHVSHWGVEPDDTRAAELFISACEKGMSQTPTQLDEMRALGRVPPNLEERILSLEKKEQPEQETHWRRSSSRICRAFCSCGITGINI